MSQTPKLSTFAKACGLQLRVDALATLAAAAHGCSKSRDSNRLPVFPVIGHLSVNGQTPTGAFVVLHPKNGTAIAPSGEAVHPRAVVKPDGSFVVGTYGAEDGAPSGEYSLTVEWRKIIRSSDGSPVLGPNVVPAKFARPQTSPVSIRIAEKSNELDLIKVK
jgi:hypothetical protein